MKIGIIGVGAIGGYVGIRLALAGEDVTFIARGATLDALRTRGIRLVNANGSEESVPEVRATDSYASAGPQDMVILAVKAHQVEAVADDVPKLLGAETVVVPMQNGIPYWYFHGFQGAFAGTRVSSVDPSGLIYQKIPCERVIGCVVYPAAELLAPGVIKHVEGNRFPVGEPDGATSERVSRVAQCFVRGGMQSPHQRLVTRNPGRHLPISAQSSHCIRDDGRGADGCPQTWRHIPCASRETHCRC